MTIKAEELRLGNLIYNTKGEVDTVTIEVLTYIHSHADIHQASPIPLTEEWLVKFGLIKQYLENPFEEGGFDLKEDGTRWYHWVDGGVFNLEIQPNGEIWFEVYANYKHIEYVHQLQNLYFALTSEELILKTEQ